MANNVSKEEYIKRLMTTFNTVAANNPEMLDSLMTDDVLECIMKELCAGIKFYYEKYKECIDISELSSESISNRDYAKNIAISYRRTLASSNKLYKAYESLRAARNLEIDFDFDPSLVSKALDEEDKKLLP